MTPIIMIPIITIDSQHSNKPLIDTDEAAGAPISSFFTAEIAEQEAQIYRGYTILRSVTRSFGGQANRHDGFCYQ